MFRTFEFLEEKIRFHEECFTIFQRDAHQQEIETVKISSGCIFLRRNLVLLASNKSLSLKEILWRRKHDNYASFRHTIRAGVSMRSVFIEIAYFEDGFT